MVVVSSANIKCMALISLRFSPKKIRQPVKLHDKEPSKQRLLNSNKLSRNADTRKTSNNTLLFFYNFEFSLLDWGLINLLMLKRSLIFTRMTWHFDFCVKYHFSVNMMLT